MNTTTSSPTPLSFLMLLDPAAVLAAADRVSKSNLPRRICRPLDRRVPLSVSADVAAYDAEVEETDIADEAEEVTSSTI